MISMRKIVLMGRTYRYAIRYEEILSILIKYGLGIWLML